MWDFKKGASKVKPISVGMSVTWWANGWKLEGAIEPAVYDVHQGFTGTIACVIGEDQGAVTVRIVGFDHMGQQYVADCLVVDGDSESPQPGIPYCRIG